MAVLKDCHQRLQERLEKRLLKIMTVFKDYRNDCCKVFADKTAHENLLKSVKIHSFSGLGAGIPPVDLTTLSSLRADRMLKTVVKCKCSRSPSVHDLNGRCEKAFGSGVVFW